MRLIDSLKNHWRLTVILLIYMIIAGAHSVVVPLTIGNDEWAHFLYARFIVEHGRLPINLAERQNKDPTTERVRQRQALEVKQRREAEPR